MGPVKWPSRAGAPRFRLAALLLVGAVVALVQGAAVDTLVGLDCLSPHRRPSLPTNATPPGRGLLCGKETPLAVRAEIALPATAPGLSSTGPFPMALTSKACTVGDEEELDVLGAAVIAYNAATGRWLVDVNCSLADADDASFAWKKDQAAVPFTCDLSAAVWSNATRLQVDLPVFALLPVKYEISGLTLLNKPTPTTRARTGDATVGPTVRRHLATSDRPLLGIDAIADFRLEATGAHGTERAASLMGSCVVNHENVTVSGGRLAYKVQRNDSDVAGLDYKCELVDALGHPPSKPPTGRVQSVVLQIDGSLPELEDGVFMLFSTDKPARIGSVISLTLKAKHLTQGYTGTCVVNGVNGVPLLEAEDHGFYIIQYTVSEGDASRDLDKSGTMPVSCLVQNPAGNTFEFKKDVELGFGIDAIRPKMASTSILFSSDRPAHEGSIIEIQVTFQENEPHLRVAKNASCLVNNASVGASLSKSTANSYLITYVVGKGEAHWKAGALPIRCMVQDGAGNTALIDHFTDGNTLFARELKPMELDADEVISTEFLPDKLLIISFIIVAIASHSISKVCPHVGLPRISGYILTGILIGPYVLNFITSRQIRQLRIIDELSMAYIGITAGSKLHWNHMKPIMKSILAITIGLTLVEYVIGTLTITVLAGYIDFLQDTSDSEKYAIALLAGCMMIARSPSSALAVIEETKSQGHFTTLIFAVTVMCDVLVIFLFNVNSMITESFLSEKEMSGDDILRLVLQLCGSTGVGLVLGKLMGWIVFWRPRSIKRKSVWFKCQQVLKQFLILLYGWSIFVICHMAHPYLEPLLCCMVSGAVMWNTTTNPEELGLLLKNLADLVYVSFFTITGATLELDMLVKAMALSLVLCLTRVIAIFLGSFLGGVAAGEDRRHSKVAWMAYITQAGVTLGLAKQIQLMYPGWGSYFSTMIVAVVICNQLIGPPLLRYVLRFVGDAKKKEIGKVDGLNALVFSGGSTINLQSAILRLEMCGWNVHSHEVRTTIEESKEKAFAEDVSEDVKEMLTVVKPLEVVVVMMPTDAENFEVIRAVANTCQKLRRISVLRIVVQVAGLNAEENAKWSSRFTDMPATLEHGDTIDVIVIDRIEATDMLIELAACGKVVNIAEKQATTAIAMEDGDTDVEGDGRDSVSSVSSGVRLRQTLKYKVRRMMLV